MTTTGQPFLHAFGIKQGDVICLTGAGGKTSLMLRLAQEGRAQGWKVLVTTSTRIRIPDTTECDVIDLSGKLFSELQPAKSGIYVGGLPDTSPGKMTGVREDLLAWQKKHFDLTLIEADGAACKPLKGWKSTEPVIPDCTTKTIGVLDIQTLGKTVDETLVHRLEIFTELSGARTGEPLAIGHLLRLIIHDDGLFSQSGGKELLYINKVESAQDIRHTQTLCRQLENLEIVAGSVQNGTINEYN